ncbi:VOC family protein [Mycolicibacter hiberniae]|uniref:Lactoylglutathione lyase n=1 Tax=Mycolicibacter hiberniae TaxID=29314 RepID=A0A7I7X2J8_9MYCO|nr:VOC family protein [Mycolicibacter hiberniae]MCV7084435.1 VOC family protein [Mycolicibacter hiberniae]ORV67539.1 lactoylglutathione lyase [Mycolicibacter hiberniae]BBZ22971.1 lactoylglutathione lyase [Mycolicibacter hiberniae]
MTPTPRPPVQIAWVTRDLEATESTLSALLGVRKWVRMPGVHFAPQACTYLGEPADFVADIALSYLGDMQLELIAPVRGRSLYDDFLQDGRGPGLHHVCIEAADPDDFEAMLNDAAEQGAQLVARGVMPGGMCFAYVSAPDAGIPYLEIAYIPAEIRSVFDYIKQQQR